jgi:hypothetical protein
MYIKKCPTCNNDINYKSKDSLKSSIKKNSNCRKCMGDIISKIREGMVFTKEHKDNLSKAKIDSKLSDQHKKNIGLSVKGLKRSDDSKKKYSESKMGDKNPAKREDVKNKIRQTILGKYLSDPTYKERISKSLEKYFKNNPSFISYYELEGYIKYKNKVDRITRSNKKKLVENWNGVDYYDNEIIKDNFNLHYNDAEYPTIDHKFSIIYGFKNGFSTEFVGSVENLCFTKRKLNSEKGKSVEQVFKDRLKK